MESNQNAPSGSDASTSGSADVQSGESAGGDSQETGTYPAHFVEKLKKEKGNKVRENEQLKARLEALEQEQAQSQVKDLEEKEQFKTLYEQERAKRTDIESKFMAQRQQIVEGRKRSAVKKELLKLGLRPEKEDIAFRLMDTSAVVIDDETNVLYGAEEVAKAFYEQNRDLGIFGRAVPGVSHQAPQQQKVVSKRASDGLTQDEIRQKLKELESMGS